MRNEVIDRVGRLYERLAAESGDAQGRGGECNACGKCCDFESFDHRLYVTRPELMYLSSKLGGERVKPMTGGMCPYNVAGKCTVYDYRFAGCRIFCCNGDAEFQSDLSERALEELKSICTELDIPYRYMDLATALNAFSANQ
ncbi:MAG: hypothetical protein JW720_07660 [Sedimentisphaerales bacterium]|nr:hypothetical protein [Sedimentisphaerales bacterium]